MLPTILLILVCLWMQERELQEMKVQEQHLELQQKIIEEERQRLLQQHAPNLIGYLPKVRTR